MHGMRDGGPLWPGSKAERGTTMRNTLLAIAGASALMLAAVPAANAAKFSPGQTALTVGGGVADFARGRIGDASTPSGAWDARLTVGTRSFFSFEANYLGTLGAEHDPIGPDPKVGSTQLTGSARINFTRWRIQPFITGGAGWINLHSYGRDQAPVAAATFAHNDNGVVVPMGGGIDGYLGRHGLIDARFTYNLVAGSKDFTSERQRPDMWVAQLNAGYAF